MNQGKKLKNEGKEEKKRKSKLHQTDLTSTKKE